MLYRAGTEVSAGCKIFFKGEYNQNKRKGENYPTAKDSEDQVSESMDRTMPYFVERIATDAVDQEKRVLISSSENAIRGLLTHLCDIPENEITGIEIPNV
jgi:bisphosphoglycerate-dependent phosphoglycerate mutase